MRKFTMRAIGASGALALAAFATIVVAPNFTSPGPYMAAIFVGTLLTAYIGEGGGILSYLAIGGTAFVIGYGGPGPRADVLGSIWSIWGISLGMIIRAAVSLLWRERASRTLAEQFQAPLAAMLELVKDGRGYDDSRRRAAAERSAVAGIAMMLTIANDAMLEGRGAEIDGDQLIDALDTLRRLAFALGNLARVRPAGTAMSAGMGAELTTRSGCVWNRGYAACAIRRSPASQAARRSEKWLPKPTRPSCAYYRVTSLAPRPGLRDRTARPPSASSG